MGGWPSGGMYSEGDGQCRLVRRPRGLDQLQSGRDEWLAYYNADRTHQGKMCRGRAPMQNPEYGRKENLEG